MSGAPEFATLQTLIAKAAAGLKFSAAAANSVRGDYQALFSAAPTERLLGLLGILLRLSQDGAAAALCSSPASGDAEISRDRIDRVLGHIHQAYSGEVRMEALAAIAALSVSGLHRMFIRHTQSTISDYLIRLRIGDACARLSSTSQPVAHIAESVGYASLANFNRQFKRLRGLTPRQYRKRFLTAPHPASAPSRA
jgi:AraC-like DNA-binding protein